MYGKNVHSDHPLQSCPGNSPYDQKIFTLSKILIIRLTFILSFIFGWGISELHSTKSHPFKYLGDDASSVSMKSNENPIDFMCSYGLNTYTTNIINSDGSKVSNKICNKEAIPKYIIPTNHLELMAMSSEIDANDDINQTEVNNPVVGNVLTNDNVLNGDNLIVTTSPVTLPSSGSVSINADGSYTYTPNSGYSGDDAFTYEVCTDGSTVVCDTARVSLQIFAPPSLLNNYPLPHDDTAVTHEGVAVTGNLSGNDIDADGDLFLYVNYLTHPPSNGTISFNNVGAAGMYTYTPNPGFVGFDTILILVQDNSWFELQSSSWLTIEVKPSNSDNELYAQDDAGLSLGGSDIDGNLLANDIDPEGNSFTINTSPISGPTNGSVTINTDGSYTYSPNANYRGNDSFTYEE